MHIRYALLVSAVCLTAMTSLSVAQTGQPIDSTGGYHVLASYPVGGDGGWDLLTLDSSARRLYIARATRVMVVDADTGKLIGEIPGTGVHGVAVVSDTNRGFITNGKDDSVAIFDLKTLEIVGHAKTGTKPDAIIYDAVSKHVFVCNNGASTLTVLAPTDGKVEATIDVGGAPELVTVDGKGRLYTNLEDKNEVGVVDTIGLKALAHWPLAPGSGPSGIAVDAEHHRVFSVCHDSKTMVVLDADSGKAVASLPIGARADGAAFDPATGDVFSPNGDGTLTVIHEQNPNTFAVVQTAATKAGARTIALDEKSHRLYLVTADKKPDAAGEPSDKRHPQYLPGTFAVLVVGR
jgi:YVTN family beta-propeller protein